MKQGFTLIELLAVIVILAIIAIIAVPIVLNIINNTEEKANMRSAEMYLKAVSLSIEKQNLDGEFNPTTCEVQTDGNLECVGKTDSIIVEVDNPAIEGTITFEKGKIVTVIGLKINSSTFDFRDGNLELLKKYIVKFDSNGGSSISNQEILTHRKAQEPTSPTKEGYVFQGWQLGDQDYDFDTPITQSITLKAKWETLITPKFYSALSTLPSGYQEVDYIESSGGQYIDTGIYLTQDDTVYADIKFTHAFDYSNAKGIFGTRQSYTKNALYAAQHGSSIGLSVVRSGTTSHTYINSALSQNDRVRIINSPSERGVVGASYDNTVVEESLTAQTTCTVFKANGEWASRYWQGIVYSFEIVNKFSGVPCYRTSDGKAGLYDTVSNTFFPNNGSGKFNIGFKEIETEYQYTNVIPSAPEVSGYSFVEWNTLPDGSGISYNVGDTILYSDIMSDEVDLYAIYEVEI